MYYLEYFFFKRMFYIEKHFFNHLASSHALRVGKAEPMVCFFHQFSKNESVP